LKIQKTYFYVTGFGKFANILENPTTYLVRALPELLKNNPQANVHLAHHEIVKVAVEDCDERLKKIYQKVKRNLNSGNGSNHVVINFGVAAGRKLISLETLGKNIKDFRCPDERGNKFEKCPIDPFCGQDKKIYCSSLNLERVCDIMKKTYPVELS